MGGTRSQLCESRDSVLPAGTSAWSDGLQGLSAHKCVALISSTLVSSLSCDLLEDQDDVLFIFIFPVFSSYS